MPPPRPAAPRVLDHPDREGIELEQVLHALSDPVRLQIVRALADLDGEVPCSVIDLAVAKSTSTHHFRVLREAGLIRQEYQGTAKMTRLRRADLEELFPGLLPSVLEGARRQSARRAARAAAV